MANPRGAPVGLRPQTGARGSGGTADAHRQAMMKRSLALSVALLLCAWAGRSAAQEPVEVAPVEPLSTPPSPVLEPTPLAPAPTPPSAPAGNARLALGYRHGIIADRGFDRFAMDDRLSQLSLETSYAALNGKAGAVAAGLAWDFGSRGTTTNDLHASIVVHRITVPLEGRVYLAPWAYGFGRFAPGLAAYQARVTSAATPLAGAAWVAAADASVGVSLLLGPHGEQRSTVARVWLTPEVGYGWAQASGIGLSGERGPAILASPRPPERLSEVAVRGAFFRAQIGFTL